MKYTEFIGCTPEEFIAKVNEIVAPYTVSWVQCSNQDGDSWVEPKVRVPTKSIGNQLVTKLRVECQNCKLDLYEDDDGEGDQGEPIILQIWSVKLLAGGPIGNAPPMTFPQEVQPLENEVVTPTYLKCGTQDIGNPANIIRMNKLHINN